MNIILRRSLTGVAESPWNGWPDVHGISGRIAVDWVAECAWTRWPNDRGIRILPDQSRHFRSVVICVGKQVVGDNPRQCWLFGYAGKIGGFGLHPQYGRYRGDIVADLHACVPTVANWSMTGIPKTISTSQVQSLLAGCDRQSVAGRRDYALLLLIREGRLQEAAAEPALGAFLNRIAPEDSDFDLATELYNGHLWTDDSDAQRRNLLAAAIAHFEARKPIDKLATLARAAGAGARSRL